MDERTGNQSSSGYAPQAALPDAYDEDAFHSLLEIERKRSELSNRPFVLMLIEWTRHSSLNGAIDAPTARKLFAIVSNCLRETDFVGWYREGRVAGAVLTQNGEPDPADASEAVRQRVSGALDKHFHPERAGGFLVHVYRLSPQVNPWRE